MQGSAQVRAQAYDLRFGVVDHRRVDADIRLRAGAGRYGPGKGRAEVLRAVGIPGAVFFHDADVDGPGAEGFGPGDAQAEEVGVSEGDVGDRDIGTLEVGVGDGNVRVGKRRPADSGQRIGLEDGAPLWRDAVEVGNVGEGLAFPGLGALPVREVEQGQVVGLGGNSGGNTAVESAAEEDNGDRFHADLAEATIRLV